MAAHRSSRVHPKYKTKYRVGNWSEYERGLRARGDVTVWFTEEAIEAWTPPKSGRRKLHLGVDETGVIVAEKVTDSTTDDAAVVPDLLDQIDADVQRFIADGAYDKWPVYESLTARGATERGSTLEDRRGVRARLARSSARWALLCSTGDRIAEQPANQASP